MKRKITSLALSVVLILLSVLFLNNEKVVEAADDLLLLENRHPGYWSYLRPEMGSVVYVPPEGAKNLLITDIKTQTQNGITLTVNDDHTITLNGTNTGDGFNFVFGSLVLPDGDYIMSDGAEISEINMYVWKNGLKTTAAYGNDEVLNINNEVCSYHCGIHIDPFAVFQNVVIYPMIRNSGNDSYSPYLTSNQCEKAFVYEAEKDDVTVEDMKTFERSIKNVDASWISILYPDGTGIQFKDGHKIEGNVDIYGRA